MSAQESSCLQALPTSRSARRCLTTALLSPLERIRLIGDENSSHKGMTCQSAGLCFQTHPSLCARACPLRLHDPPVLPQSSCLWPLFPQILRCHQEFSTVQPPHRPEPPSSLRHSSGLSALFLLSSLRLSCSPSRTLRTSPPDPGHHILSGLAASAVPFLWLYSSERPQQREGQALQSEEHGGASASLGPGRRL